MKSKGRAVPPLVLEAEERAILERWARRPKTAQALAQRSRMILACAGGKSDSTVAAELRVTRHTVGRWRRRFLARRLDGLLDEPRPGAPRAITDADVEPVITLTLESKPKGEPSASSRIEWRRSSCLTIPCSSRRCGTSWAST